MSETSDERAKRIIDRVEELGDFKKLGGRLWCFSVFGRGLLDASELRVIADELDRRNAARKQIECDGSV